MYIPVDKGKRVEVGMTIQLAPNGVDVSESGSLIGVVRTGFAVSDNSAGHWQNLGLLSLRSGFCRRRVAQ